MIQPEVVSSVSALIKSRIDFIVCFLFANDSCINLRPANKWDSGQSPQNTETLKPNPLFPMGTTVSAPL